jgi:hypothetical protein
MLGAFFEMGQQNLAESIVPRGEYTRAGGFRQ